MPKRRKKRQGPKPAVNRCPFCSEETKRIDSLPEGTIIRLQDQGA